MKWSLFDNLLFAALWLHEWSDEYPPLSWFIHALFALPLCLLGPHVPFAVFAYREGEQALHAHWLGGEPWDWRIVVDRVMDVLAPAVVGWWLG